MDSREMNELMTLERSIKQGDDVSGPKLERFKELRSMAGSAYQDMNFEAMFRRFIAQEVDHQLKVKMASQNMEMVEELYDKFRFLIDRYDLPNPSAADIALWKAGKK